MPHSPSNLPEAAHPTSRSSRWVQLQANISPFNRWPRFLRAGLKSCVWAGVTLYFLTGFFVLVLRYGVLPQIENYHRDIEQVFSRVVNQPVHIGSIQANWAGLRPRLDFKNIEIRDSTGHLLLSLDHVIAEPAWDSLLYRELRLARLEFISPQIVLSRDKSGHFFAAGLDITPKPEDQGGFTHWLFTQHQILIHGASLTWQDNLRNAPPLELKKLDFQLNNRWQSHRFGLTAEPPAHLAGKLDLRGNLRGNDLTRLSDWSGKAYVNIDNTDLAGWHPWVDYPVRLPKGQGALTLWADFAEAQINAATADVHLANVLVQIKPELPALDLKRLTGRLSAARLAHGFSVDSKQLTLTTRQGLSLLPTDITLQWQSTIASANAIPGLDLLGIKTPANGAQKSKPHGRFIANRLDLDTLTQLAAYFPLPETAHAALITYAPRGVLSDVSLTWQGPLDHPQQWSINSQVRSLNVRHLGMIESLSGINGHIAGTDQQGSLSLEGTNSEIVLPTLFAEPKLSVDKFSAQAKWLQTTTGLGIELTHVDFSNPDAAGQASGTWQALPQGPGQIDLTATLTRANGHAVWRYIPLAVGQSTRSWLQEGILTGDAQNTQLTLKGNLIRFPFRGGPGKNQGGIFEVRGKIQGVTLNYAAGWPTITDIDGELLFSGERMLISGHSGKILGVNLRDVRAEIKDIESSEELLSVTGKASGPTADFLRYIESSPVGGRIDHFTEAMKASGTGELDLALNLPLQAIQQSTVAGQYRFDNNQITIDNGVPPLGSVRGVLKFSDNHLEARELHATLLGSPLTATIATRDGGVQVGIAGDLTIAALRRQWAHPIFDHLSGSTKWRGNLQIKNKAIEALFTSNLTGISSSLPEPFNKSAKDALPLRLERRTLADPANSAFTPIPRDVIDIRLGSMAQLQLQRRHDVSPPIITQGLLAIGNTANLPGNAYVRPQEQPFIVRVNLPKLNADAWRGILMSKSGDTTDTAFNPALPLAQFDLRLGELSLFDNVLHDVRATGSQTDKTTLRADLKSRELSGKLAWQNTGHGKLTAHLDKFALPESSTAPANLQAKTNEIIDELPALDIRIDELSLKKQLLGSLSLTAENRDSAWHTLINLKNDTDNLKLKGRWQPRPGKSSTQLDFDFESKAIEKTLSRLGYAEAIYSNRVALDGQLRWQGDPLKINIPSLSGYLSINTDKGNIKELEPGVGRLLGILNIQTLLRRITLDFRDIFGKGFAFDVIKGGFNIDNGIMETSDLQVRAPSARILFDGRINLINETQDMHALVQPTLGESVSIGTMIVSPIAGAAVWAAQKILKDPFGQVFAMEYQITGSLSNPKIVSTHRPASAFDTKAAEKTQTPATAAQSPLNNTP